MGRSEEFFGNVYGSENYGKGLQAQARVARGYRKRREMQVNANQTKTVDVGFDVSELSFLFIQAIAKSGTTDTTLSIHESDSYDATDLIYQLTQISTNDSLPSGGQPNQGAPLPYHEEDGNNVVHVKVDELSGNAGNILLKLTYL